MWKLLVICVIAALVMSIEGGRNRKRYATTGGYAGGGTYAGASTGGFAGGYDDYDYGYAPGFGGFIDPYLFHQQLTAQILSDHAAQNNYIQQQIAAQSAYNGGGGGGYYSNKGYKNNRYAPNYAAAAGSIGPGGYHQTAYISPENPAIPNISNRFGSSSPGGFKGVSVSSFSSSSDINGHKSGQRGAQTTINDNGKITTYRVHS